MTLEELGKRIRTLEDIEEIKQLQARYVNCLTTIEWDELTDCFAENGVADLTVGLARGKGEIARFFKEDISRTHVGLEGNFVVHPVISVEGGRAKGSWLLYTQFSLPHKIQPVSRDLPAADAPDWMQGFYEMEYVKENGKWKISLLKWRRRIFSPRKE